MLTLDFKICHKPVCIYICIHIHDSSERGTKKLLFLIGRGKIVSTENAVYFPLIDILLKILVTVTLPKKTY